MTPEKLMGTTLHPRKALQLLALRYPVNGHYRAVMEEEQPEMPMPQDSYMAVFRHEDTV